MVCQRRLRCRKAKFCRSVGRDHTVARQTHQLQHLGAVGYDGQFLSCTANRRADRIEHCRPRNSTRSQHQQIRRNTLRQQRIGCLPQCLIQQRNQRHLLFVLIEQDAQHILAPHIGSTAEDIGVHSCRR